MGVSFGMAKTPKPIDPVERERLRLAFRTTRPSSAPLDPAGASERLSAAWALMRPIYEASLPHAPEEGRAAFARAAAFADAGMPAGRRDPGEQAAFYAIVIGAPQSPPSWHDLVDRWIDAGGLAYAIEVIVRIPGRGGRRIDNTTHLFLRPDADAYLYWSLLLLLPRIEAMDAASRAALHEHAAAVARSASAYALACIAILFDDEPLAKEAIALAESDEAFNYRDPWPCELLAILRSGPEFGRMLAHGAAPLQFYGPGYVQGAIGRLPDADLADALVRFFAAAMAEPRRMLDTYVAKFAAAACAIPDPRLAWLFHEHGKHKWLKKHTPLYAESHPTVRPERPREDALATRMRPEKTVPRPAGFTKAELDVLDPTAREERILSQLRWGHLGTAFALRLLAEYPTPAAAVAIHEKITSPNFATQMPKPGFHKELQSDLSALGKKHPDLAKAIAAAKKAKKTKE